MGNRNWNFSTFSFYPTLNQHHLFPCSFRVSPRTNFLIPKLRMNFSLCVKIESLYVCWRHSQCVLQRRATQLLMLGFHSCLFFVYPPAPISIGHNDVIVKSHLANTKVTESVANGSLVAAVKLDCGSIADQRTRHYLNNNNNYADSIGTRMWLRSCTTEHIACVCAKKRLLMPRRAWVCK